MAKSQSIQTHLSNHYPTKYYRITYETPSPKDFKNVKGITARTTHNRFFAEDVVDEFIKEAKEHGWKKIKKEMLRADFPRKCPKCGDFGSPSIVKGKKTYAITQTKMSDEEKAKLVTNRLIYHHSKSPETCFIGYVNISRNGIEIKLQKNLTINALGYSKRISVDPLK